MLANYLMRKAGERAGPQPFRLVVDHYFRALYKIGDGTDSGRGSVRAIRKLLKVKNDKAMAVRHEGYRRLDLLDVQVESRLYYRLMTAGFVPGNGEVVR